MARYLVQTNDGGGFVEIMLRHDGGVYIFTQDSTKDLTMVALDDAQLAVLVDTLIAVQNEPRLPAPDEETQA